MSQYIPTVFAAAPTPAPGLRHLANVEYSDLFTILATRDRARFAEARTAYSLKGDAPRLAPANIRSPALRTHHSKGSFPSLSDDDTTLVNDELEQLLKHEKEVRDARNHSVASLGADEIRQAAVVTETKSLDTEKQQERAAETFSQPPLKIASPDVPEAIREPKRALPEDDSEEDIAAEERDQVFSHYVSKIREQYTFGSFQDTIRDIIEESQKKYRPLAEGVRAPMPSTPLSTCIVDTDSETSTERSSTLGDDAEAPCSVAPKRPRVSTPAPAPETAKERFNRKQLLLDLVACALPHKLSPQWRKVKLNLGRPKAWLRSSRKRDLPWLR